MTNMRQIPMSAIRARGKLRELEKRHIDAALALRAAAELTRRQWEEGLICEAEAMSASIHEENAREIEECATAIGVGMLAVSMYYFGKGG